MRRPPAGVRGRAAATAAAVALRLRGENVRANASSDAQPWPIIAQMATVSAWRPPVRASAGRPPALRRPLAKATARDIIGLRPKNVYASHLKETPFLTIVSQLSIFEYR